jgi:hypothetical protein
MTKKERSPKHSHESPNPRPKRRNKKQREGPRMRRSSNNSSAPSPPSTPPPNSYSVLHSDSSDENTNQEGYTTPRTNSGNEIIEANSTPASDSSLVIQDTSETTERPLTYTRSNDPPPTMKNNHVNNLEPHKQSNILLGTLHPGGAPNSPLEPVPVAEISH